MKRAKTSKAARSNEALPAAKRVRVRTLACGNADCGANHGDCISSWKGSCDRAAGHDGSHHCSSCGMSF